MNFIFPILVMIVVFFVISKGRKRRQGVFEQVRIELGFDLEINPRSGVVEMLGATNGRSVKLEFTPKTRNHGPAVNVMMKIDQPYSFTLKRQTAFTGFTTQLGISQDVVIGDAEFDNAFEVHVDDSEENSYLFADSTFRSLAMELCTARFVHIVASPGRIMLREYITENDNLGTHIHHILKTLADLGNQLIENNLLGEIRASGDEGESIEAPATVEDTEPDAEITSESEAREPEPKVKNEPESTAEEPEPESVPAPTSNQFSEPVSEQNPEPSFEPVSEPIAESIPAPEPTPESGLPSETVAEAPDDLLKLVDDGKLLPDECAAKIAGSGTDAIAEVVRALGGYDRREPAKKVLLAMDAEVAIPVLVGEMKQYSLAYEIKLLLRELPEPGAKRLLEEIGVAHDEEVTKAIFEAIGELKIEGAVEKLTPFLADESFSVRYAAESALRRAGVDYDELSRLKREAGQ